MNGSILKDKGITMIFLLRYFIRMMLPALIVFTVFIIMIFVFYTPFIEKQHMKNRENSCRYLVDVVIDYLYSLNEDVSRGILSEKEAKERAFRRIRSLRYGSENRDYFWIINSGGVMIMHPFRSDLEKKDPSKTEAPDGQALSRLMQEMSFLANTNTGGATIKYIWNRWDNLSEFGTKVSFVKKFQPWGWIIGTGVYTDEAEKEIKNLKWKFIFLSILLGLFSSSVSLMLSYRAGISGRKEEEARQLLIEKIGRAHV